MIQLGKYCRCKRYNFNTADMQYLYEKGNKLESGFTLEEGYCQMTITDEEFIDDIGFYTHEFSELSLIKLIRKCTTKYQKCFRFKYFAPTDMPHLISPCGYLNKRTLCPDSDIRKPYKKLLKRLTQDELKVRRDIGIGWDS